MYDIIGLDGRIKENFSELAPDYSGQVFWRNDLKQLFVEFGLNKKEKSKNGRQAFYFYSYEESADFFSSETAKANKDWLGKMAHHLPKFFLSKNQDRFCKFIVKGKKIIFLSEKICQKRIEALDYYYIFNRYVRWDYLPEDFSFKEFQRIVRKIGLKTQIEGRVSKENVYIKGSAFVGLRQEIIRKIKDKDFLNNFFNYYSGFIKRNSTLAQKEAGLPARIKNLKKLNFQTSIIDHFHWLIIITLKKHLTKRYELDKKTRHTFFSPALTFTTLRLLHLEKRGKCPPIPEEIRQNIKDNYNKKKKLISEFSGQKRDLFQAMRKMIWLKDYVDIFYWRMNSFHLKGIFTEAGAKGIELNTSNHKDLLAFTNEEIKNYAGKKKFPKIKRLKAYQKEKRASEARNKNDLSGIVASPGDFDGVVKLVRSEKDLEGMQKNDIMVAELTNPHLVPGMAICRGIITEQGGLTSHAAIVSRELGKPCLVGVKGCTRILQNGDKLKIVKGKICKLNK